MESGIKNITFRILALILGLTFLGMSVFMAFIGTFDLWVGFFLGPLLIYYSIVGNKGLSENRWLSSYGRKVGK
jgi:hypothetical protein